jgi:hypothetical protein
VSKEFAWLLKLERSTKVNPDVSKELFGSMLGREPVVLLVLALDRLWDLNDKLPKLNPRFSVFGLVEGPSKDESKLASVAMGERSLALSPNLDGWRSKWPRGDEYV